MLLFDVNLVPQQTLIGICDCIIAWHLQSRSVLATPGRLRMETVTNLVEVVVPLDDLATDVTG